MAIPDNGQIERTCHLEVEATHTEPGLRPVGPALHQRVERVEGEETEETDDDSRLVGVRKHPQADADLSKEEDSGTEDRDRARGNRAVLATL
jgi:hypothetical protein